MITIYTPRLSTDYTILRPDSINIGNCYEDNTDFVRTSFGDHTDFIRIEAYKVRMISA